MNKTVLKQQKELLLLQ